jgi:hypothetical protein
MPWVEAWLWRRAPRGQERKFRFEVAIAQKADLAGSNRWRSTSQATKGIPVGARCRSGPSPTSMTSSTTGL